MFTYGFYNSLNHDRLYNASQFSTLFDMLITDGVFRNIEGIFGTVPGEGLQVIVRPGMAWVKHTWNLGDNAVPYDLETPDMTLDRYDAVVLEVDNDKRENCIKVITGEAAADPVKPELVKDDISEVWQYPLAYVLVRGGATEIMAQDIEIMVGTEELPFVTGILESVSIEVLFQGWDEEFHVWFNNLKLHLAGDVAANLQQQIDTLFAEMLRFYYGPDAPAASLGKDGDIYVKTK